MDQSPLRIVYTFSQDDQHWLRRFAVDIPSFWDGHSVAPAVNDALRIGGRQFTINGRVWEEDEQGILLRLILSSAFAESDTIFS